MYKAAMGTPNAGGQRSFLCSQSLELNLLQNVFEAVGAASEGGNFVIGQRDGNVPRHAVASDNGRYAQTDIRDAVFAFEH